MYKKNGFKELDKIARDIESDCHAYFNGTGNKFVLNLYNFNLLLCCIHFLTQSNFFVFSYK